MLWISACWCEVKSMKFTMIFYFKIYTSNMINFQCFLLHSPTTKQNKSIQLAINAKADAVFQVVQTVIEM